MSPGLGYTYQDEEDKNLTVEALNLLEEPEKMINSVQDSQNSKAVSSAARPRDVALSKAGLSGFWELSDISGKR